MGLGDGAFRSAASGLLVVLGAMVAAPVVLPVLAMITRPLAKAAIHLYLDVAADIREVLDQHRPRQGDTPGLIPHLLSEGTGELVAAGLEGGVEAEAEGSLAETVAEVIAEIW